jgi:hypothetical protein
MTNIDKALEILRLTEDGNKLSPSQLYLLQLAVNNHLNELGQQEFNKLHQKVLDGNYQEFFHDIEHLTQDHEGYISWKGIPVEHYSFRDYEKEKAAAQDLAAMCRHLESIGVEVSWGNVLSGWWKYKPEEQA